MIKIHRVTDKLPIKIGDLTFLISPLTFEQKIALAGLTKMVGGEEQMDNLKLTYNTLKYALKGMEGATYHDGSPFVCSFDDDGTISKQSLDEIAQVADLPKLFVEISKIATNQPNDANIEMKPKVVESKKKVHSTSTSGVSVVGKQGRGSLGAHAQ